MGAESSWSVVAIPITIALAWLFLPWILRARGWALVPQAIWMTAAGVFLFGFLLGAVGLCFGTEAWVPVLTTVSALWFAVRFWYAVLPMGTLTVFCLAKFASTRGMRSPLRLSSSRQRGIR